MSVTNESRVIWKCQASTCEIIFYYKFNTLIFHVKEELSSFKMFTLVVHLKSY